MQFAISTTMFCTVCAHRSVGNTVRSLRGTLLQSCSAPFLCLVVNSAVRHGASETLLASLLITASQPHDRYGTATGLTSPNGANRSCAVLWVRSAMKTASAGNIRFIRVVFDLPRSPHSFMRSVHKTNNTAGLGTFTDMRS